MDDKTQKCTISKSFTEKGHSSGREIQMVQHRERGPRAHFSKLHTGKSMLVYGANMVRDRTNHSTQFGIGAKLLKRATILKWGKHMHMCNNMDNWLFRNECVFTGKKTNMNTISLLLKERAWNWSKANNQVTDVHKSLWAMCPQQAYENQALKEYNDLLKHGLKITLMWVLSMDLRKETKMVS